MQEVKKLSGQNEALKKTTQNAADAVSQANTNFNMARAGVKQTESEISRCNQSLRLAQTNWDAAGKSIDASRAAITTFGKEISLAESRFRLATAGIKDMGTSVEGLSAKLTLLREKLDMQEKSITQYENALRGAREQLQAAQQANDPEKIQQASDAVLDAEAALNRAKAAVKATRAEIEETNRQLSTARSAWTAAGKSLESFGKSCDSVSKKMTTAGRTLTTVMTPPILTLGTAAVKASLDFESSFAGVRKTVDATEAEFASLAASSKKMSTEIASSTSEINAVMATGGQLGIANEHLTEFTRVMIDLGNSCEDLSADEAATSIAKFANVMGTNQSLFQNIGSTIVDLGNNFATTEKPIMEMAQRLAGAGKQVGLTEAQVLGFATALSSVGIEAQMGGSAFSKALIKMEVASATGGQALEDFGAVCGMTGAQFKALFDSDPAAAFQAFIVGLSQMDDAGESAIAVLDEIGIKEVRLRDPLLRATNATDLFSRAQATANRAWAENTALTTEANKRYATTESKLTNLKNKAVLFGQQLGDDLNPTIQSLIEGADDLLDRFMNLDEAQRMQIIRFAAIAAAAGPVMLILGKLTKGVGTLSTGIGKFATAVGKAGGGIKGFMTVLSSSPAVWLAVAAATITATVAIADYVSGARQAREALKALHAVSDYQGLPLWLASYVVYNRHAEAKDIVRWETPADIDRFLLNFRPNELRNPIVELVVRETLRVVRDIWTRYGGFDEIHVELGREMKMPAKQRQKLSKRMLENERINLRIKMMLACFQNPEFKVDEVRPYSPYQQEILKIYEEYVLHDVKEIPDDITAIIKKFDKEEANEQPSVGEVLHYKEWLDKKYISPYTGEIIPLGRLLTHDYEIEHIIPQKRYFDDSLNNKVICESAVNNLKSAQLAHEFISQHHGEVVELGHGRTARILELEDYEKWVKEHYAALPRKRRNLLLDEVPEAFIARQLNDTRYISKYVSMLLSNIVRGEDERSVNSTHLIATNGSITTRLKQDWGINDVWNAIVLPRFERLNSMAQPEDGQLAQVYVTRNTQGHPIPTVPLDRQRGFSMKRIDHRHHAMDAIVIACASRNMVNYLNNESARKDAKVSRTDLQHLLCTKTRDANGKYRWVVNKPWLTFTTDVHHALEDIVASFKQNRRIMSPTVNYFDHYDPATGKKRRKKQTQGEMQAVRMSMHDATFYGEINLRSIKEVSLKQALEQPQRIVNKDLKHKLQTLQAEGLNLKQMTAYFAEHHDEWADVNVKKIAVYVYSKEEGKARYFASRTVLDQSFTRDYIERKVADTGIQQILLRHLVHYENAEQAFSPEGIEDMNKNLKELNNGRPHQPIYKVRTYTQGVKSAVGQRNCKAAQFVNGAKGTNLYFAVYEGTEGEVSESKRSFATFSLRDVLPCLKDGKPVIPEFDKKGKRLKFVLSPLDLVYVPTPEDLKLGQVQLPLNKKRIYKMVSCSDARCFWVPVNVASAIVDKYEFSSLNKMERAVTGEMIKEICLPLDMDRLGNVHLRQ